MKNTKYKVLGVLLVIVIVYILPGSAQATRYACWRGDRAYTKQDFVRAQYWYEKALAQNPQDTQALYCWAKVAYKQKEFEQAEQAFDKVVQDTQLTQVHKEQALSSLADTAMQRQNYQKAVDNYTQALALNSTSESLKKKLAQARFLLTQQKQEREHAENNQHERKSDNITDNNERQQNGQQDNAQDNQDKGAQKQSTGTDQSKDQPQQTPNNTQGTTKNTQESGHEGKQQGASQSQHAQDQEHTKKQSADHNKPARDKQNTMQCQDTSQTQSQYNQKKSDEQQQASKAQNNQVPERYQPLVEAIAQEDQEALKRLLEHAVCKEQKEHDSYQHAIQDIQGTIEDTTQDTTHDKNW